MVMEELIMVSSIGLTVLNNVNIQTLLCDLKRHTLRGRYRSAATELKILGLIDDKHKITEAGKEALVEIG